MRRFLKGTTTAFVFVGALSLSGGAASAGNAADTTPPVLHTPSSPAFVTGAQISTTDAGPNCASPCDTTSGIKVFARWDGSDPSGIKSYDVWADDGRGPDYLLQSGLGTSYSATIQDSSGGQADLPSWDITAVDNAGNNTSPDPSASPNWIRTAVGVYQQDGHSGSDYVPTGSGPQIGYTGSWSTTTCACYTGGTARKTAAKGAAVSVVYGYPDKDNHFALVSSLGPTRGSAAVYVDGVEKAVVNTYAASSRDRDVVWQTWLAPGTHSVKVVNLATPGHPNLVFDAFMVN